MFAGVSRNPTGCPIERARPHFWGIAGDCASAESSDILGQGPETLVEPATAAPARSHRRPMAAMPEHLLWDTTGSRCAGRRGWYGGGPTEVAGDGFTAPYGASSAGPPPWHVYRFTFHTAFGSPPRSRTARRAQEQRRLPDGRCATPADAPVRCWPDIRTLHLPTDRPPGRHGRRPGRQRDEHAALRRGVRLRPLRVADPAEPVVAVGSRQLLYRPDPGIAVTGCPPNVFRFENATGELVPRPVACRVKCS
jgi:hypothetical protein